MSILLWSALGRFNSYSEVETANDHHASSDIPDTFDQPQNIGAKGRVVCVLVAFRLFGKPDERANPGTPEIATKSFVLCAVFLALGRFSPKVCMRSFEACSALSMLKPPGHACAPLGHRL